MNRSVISIALIMLFSCGCDCSRWASLPLKIETKTEMERAAIIQMNEAFGAELFQDSSDDTTIKISYPKKIISKIGHSVLGETTVSCNLSGEIDHASIQIKESLLDSDKEILVFAHELFHALGFAKHSDDGSLMEPVETGIEWDGSESIKSLISKEMIDDFYEKYSELKDD